jgi:hypothetical protein
MGTVIPFPKLPHHREVPMSKLALSKALDRSSRWIEYRMKEGMPSHDGKFLLSEVNAWLDTRARVGSSNG